jgi:hypothetical protein
MARSRTLHNRFFILEAKELEAFPRRSRAVHEVQPEAKASTLSAKSSQ